MHTTVKLSNGVEMPLAAFGTYRLVEHDECVRCVKEAIRCGYRHIDTAALYRNEEFVGEAIAQCGVPRTDIFVTTKIWINDAGYERAMNAFERARKKLGLEYIDLVLVHQPFGDYYGTWRALEELYAAKRVRAIGVSNFYPDRLTDLCLNCTVRPMVNQIETHPLFQQSDAVAYNASLGVVVEAWAPLAKSDMSLLGNTTIVRIAEAHGKTPAQVALRWNVQRGVVVLPKTRSAERMAENISIFDFSLTDEEMNEISALDRGVGMFSDHRDPAYVVKMCNYKV